MSALLLSALAGLCTCRYQAGIQFGERTPESFAASFFDLL